MSDLMTALSIFDAELAQIESDERRAWIRAAVDKAGTVSKREVSDRLMSNIDETMQRFQSEVSTQTSFRTDHDALRHLVNLAQSRERATRIIRLRLSQLPKDAKAWMDERARRCWPRVFPTDQVPPVDIGAWFQTAPGDALIEAVLAFGMEGGQRIKGRQRPTGKRSKIRLEPMIMGLVRGDAKFAGGDAGGGQIRLLWIKW